MTTAKKMPDSGATTGQATLWEMADTLRGSFERYIAEHTLGAARDPLDGLGGRAGAELRPDEVEVTA